MTVYKIALNFEDGVTRLIDCGDDEPVMEAAFRQKINIPMDCRDGVCGTCKCLCEEGRYELDFYMDEALSAQEAASGYALTCQMRPQSDCVIRIPASSAACKTKAGTVGGEVAAVEHFSPTAVGLRVRLDSPMRFLAGQYVNLSVPGTDKERAYSFSSRSGAGEATFLIRNIPGGAMGDYLVKRARAGDRLTVTGPMGGFYLRPIVRPQLWLAGGTGLAPFLSMLEEVAQTGTDQPIVLYYAVTQALDLVELERIRELAEHIRTVDVVTIVADKDAIHERKGYVTDHLDLEELNGGDIDIYLCGPPPMVEAVRDYLRMVEVVPANFYFEKFNPAAPAVRTGASEVA